MKNALKIQAVLLGVVALLLTAVLAVGLIGGLGSIFSWINFGWGSYPLTNRQALSAEGINEIALAYSAENIELAVASGHEIILEEYLKNGADSYKAQITRQGNSLDIRHGHRDVFMFGISLRTPRVLLLILYVIKILLHSVYLF